MSLNIGDFIIITENSKISGIIIGKEKNRDRERYLVAIYHKYGGYTIQVNADQITTTSLQPYEKLSIVANLGERFYQQYTRLYQEILFENIM